MRTGLPRELPINRVGDYFSRPSAEWWPAKPTPTYGGKNEGRLTSAMKLLYPDDKVPVPTFLSGDERAAGLKNGGRLSSMEDAPSFMGRAGSRLGSRPSRRPPGARGSSPCRPGGTVRLRLSEHVRLVEKSVPDASPEIPEKHVGSQNKVLVCLSIGTACRLMNSGQAVPP